jgi:hypothetical protein
MSPIGSAALNNPPSDQECPLAPIGEIEDHDSNEGREKSHNRDREPHEHKPRLRALVDESLAPIDAERALHGTAGPFSSGRIPSPIIIAPVLLTLPDQPGSSPQRTDAIEGQTPWKNRPKGQTPWKNRPKSHRLPVTESHGRTDAIEGQTPWKNRPKSHRLPVTEWSQTTDNRVI